MGCGGENSASNDRDSGGCETRILTGDVVIRSVLDIDALERAGGCSYAIAGNLEITEVLVRTLDGLPDLSSVNGDVLIYNNEELQSFDGLEDLTTIGGNVYIYDNEELTSVEGLFIQTVSGSVDIHHNEKLSFI